MLLLNIDTSDSLFLNCLIDKNKHLVPALLYIRQRSLLQHSELSTITSRALVFFLFLNTEIGLVEKKNEQKTWTIQFFIFFWKRNMFPIAWTIQFFTFCLKRNMFCDAKFIKIKI